ncbi:acetyl esterase/lipase [Salegentibacter sp. 24]|uniref:alpha/beta hydrolase fold domain-containing protein n=1 Tax=Salegentibacter sp. 24 TaxID=2183986 RepID=UPI0010DE5DD0|nr:alpha/beta hydrolase fold domain-containing protein [Salegentibacter sp. 24]TDN95429.1 acetyl esterase/lipase [Salegentibacter sp. 24]
MKTIRKKMNLKLPVFILGFILSATVFSFKSQEDSQTIYLVGDSTMADYSDNYDPGKDYMKTRYPLTGWGQVFQQFFVKDSLKKVSGLIEAENVKIDNRARGGRSTRTFFEEGRWRSVYNDLKANDIVIIQFGHNDASKEKHERFVNVKGYKEFLRLFVKQTREKNAIPILLTPVARNYPWENGKLGNVHGRYDSAVKEIAKELNVLLIDLNKRSQEFFTQKGKDYVTENYFMNLPSGKYNAYPEGQEDNTHFQPEGAKAIAQLVFDEMSKLTLFNGIPISISPYTIETTYQKLKKDYPFIEPIGSLDSEEIVTKENLVYSTIEGKELKADVYSPRNGKNYPAVLLIHGGGWVTGSKENQQIMAQHLAKNGYVAVVINYRLSRDAKFPAAVIDLKTALAWMRKNALEFGINIEKIAVLGTSAGGQLATLIGVTAGNQKFQKTVYEDQDQVEAIVNIDGIVSFIHPEAEESEIAGLWLGGLKDQNPQNWKDASPLEYVDENTPPILFINSAQERFHAGRDDMRKILEKHQIYSEVHTIPNSPHSFWLLHPWFEKTLAYTLDFLDKTLKKDLK